MIQPVPDHIRIPRKVLRMVAELHVRGYQRLRVVPFLYEVGSWRCGVTPVSNVLAAHGAMAADHDYDILPQYSSATGRDFFGWKDARHVAIPRLAELFIERFPALVRDGYGPDWAYAGWFLEMLHLTHPGSLPIAHGNHGAPPVTHLETVGAPPLRPIPLPPRGRAPERL